MIRCNSVAANASLLLKTPKTLLHSMAKKKKSAKKRTKKTSKTDAIRAALAKSETGSPTEVRDVLHKQGIHVTAAYVSTIKAADKKKALLGGPPRKPGRPAGGGHSHAEHRALSSAELEEASGVVLLAVELVMRAGGTQARHLIEQAEAMIEKVREEENG